MPDYKPLSLDDNMPYGKYKGQTLREIISKDKDYMEWIIEQHSLNVTDDVNEYIDSL